MNEPNGSDPLDRLRAADPMRADDVPSASLARVSARIQETVMSDIQNSPSPARSRRPFVLTGAIGVAGALALAVALGSGFGLQAPGPIAVLPVPTQTPTQAPTQAPKQAPTADPSAEPSVDPSAEPSVDPSAEPSVDPNDGGGAMASCLRYEPSILPNFETVFDGTVTAIDGDQITFDVNTGWKGATGTVTLTAPSASIGLIGPAPDFKVGGRYLVTAAGSDIGSCGYTLDYDAATADAWAAAFGG